MKTINATYIHLLLAAICAGLLSGCAQQPAVSVPTAIATEVVATPAAQPATGPTSRPSATPPVQPSVVPQPTPPLVTPVALEEEYLSLPTLARGYLTTPNEVRRIAALARAGQEPYTIAVAEELKYAASALDDWHENAPNSLKFSDDIEKPKYLSIGAKYVYAWAIAYNLLRDDDPAQAEVYAARARDVVLEMPQAGTEVRNYNNNTRLNLAVYIENFVYAADLLADWVPVDQAEAFAESDDAQLFKEWLGSAIVRYPYNAAFTRINNWGTWGRLTTAVIADYVGDAAPLYVQNLQKDTRGAYVVDADAACEAGGVSDCVTVDAHTMYTSVLQAHFDAVDGKLYEFSDASCDASGSKSMIRPDGGIPDELRREYECDAASISDKYGPAARYSQFALESMVSLAEVAWRRGNDSLYTHIDPATERGALYRGLLFLLDNDVTLTRGSMLEMANRFYTYQVGVEDDAAQRAEYEQLLSYDLPGVLKRNGDWPEGAGFVSFGTLTHGFADGEELQPPPGVSPR